MAADGSIFVPHETIIWDISIRRIGLKTGIKCEGENIILPINGVVYGVEFGVCDSLREGK